MIVCRRIAAALAPHRAHHVRRIVRHVRRAHRAYHAHTVSRIVCYAVAGGMALGGGAMLAHPPFEGSPWPMAMPQPGPGAELLPPSAFVAPSGAPIVWPAVYGTPIQYPPSWCAKHDTRPQCREHKRHPVPEPGGLAVLAVGLIGLAWRRRA